MYSGLDCFFIFFLGGLPQKPSLSIIFNYELVVIDTTAKEGFLPIKAKGSRDHKLPNGLWWQRGTRTPIWPMVSAQIKDSNMAFGGNMDHDHQHILINSSTTLPEAMLMFLVCTTD